MASTSLVAALVVNLFIGIMKLTVGILTGSQAMLAEAYHSFADTMNQVFLFLGIKQSNKSPDLEHPFGYQKTQFFWSFVVAILIFGISGTIAFVEGLKIVLDPSHHKIDNDLFIWNIVVLIIAIFLEFFAFKQAYNEVKAFQQKFSKKNVFEALDEMQDPVLLSLITEDSLALIGLVVALTGVIITFITQNPLIDGLTSLFIGIILMIGGLLLARENETYLIGRAVTTRIQEQIREVIDNHENVEKLVNMKTMLLGPKDMILTLDLVFTKSAEHGKIADVIDELERKLVEVVPTLNPKKIFIEAN